MKYIKTISLFFFISILSFCQNNKTGDYKEKIRNEAQIMGNFLVNKNYDEFVKYMYPPVVLRMGGKEKIIEIFNKGLSNGGVISKVTISNPSDTIMTKYEIQCTLTETIELSFNNGKSIITSTLVGISSDKGKSWYFIDANKKSLVYLRNSIPNLSERLIFPSN